MFTTQIAHALAAAGTSATATEANRRVYIGTQEALSGFLSQLSSEAGNEHLKPLADLAVQLQSNVRGTSPTTLATFINGQWFVLVCLPPRASASRHNHAGRPDQVTKGASSALGGGLTGGNALAKGETCVCVCVVEDASDVHAWGPAIARVFPLYDSRSAVNSRADEGETGAALLSSTFRTFGSVASAEDWDRSLLLQWAGASADVTEALKATDLGFVSDVCHQTRLAAAMVDAPCAEMRTTHVVARARKLAEELGDSVSVKVIAGEELRKQGFGGIYGVGKCAREFPPALVVLSYTPAEASSADKKSLCLVGKGIVFDTGGLSLKIQGNMCGMKADLGGSGQLFFSPRSWCSISDFPVPPSLHLYKAAVLHSFAAIARAKPVMPVHGVLCMAENAIGHEAQKNDDIVYMYSGKTVELNNTDAEGRLVLGDGVSYASQHLNAGLIADIATLTGAQGITTGQNHGAVMCTHETAEDAIIAAGRVSGNLCHPILFAPELLMPEFDSKVADMKNSVKNRANAQCSCAGRIKFCSIAPSFG
jgi:leucyl aminopeptidase